MLEKPYLWISAIVFGLVAVLHLVRVIFSIPVMVDGAPFSMGLSWGGVVVAALLSIWGFRLASRGVE